MLTSINGLAFAAIEMNSGVRVRRREGTSASRDRIFSQWGQNMDHDRKATLSRKSCRSTSQNYYIIEKNAIIYSSAVGADFNTIG